MDRRAILIVIALVALIFVMLAYKPVDVTDPLFCMDDSDCVPAQACHPTSCMNSAFVEESDAFCTLDCAPDTLDCGQGSCVCVDNQCEVAWSE